MSIKHIDQEEEFFARREYDRLKAIEEEKHCKMVEEEKKGAGSCTS